MKHKIVIFFALIYCCMSLNAFSPSREGLRFYVDNIFVGVGDVNIQKMPCVTL